VGNVLPPLGLLMMSRKSDLLREFPINKLPILAMISRWKMLENTEWSAKIKRSGFLQEPESASLFQCRMQKIAMLNFCAPKLSIY